MQQTVERGKTRQKAGKVKGLCMFPRNSLEDTTYNMVSTVLVTKALALLVILLGDPAMELGFVSNGSSIQSPLTRMGDDNQSQVGVITTGEQGCKSRQWASSERCGDTSGNTVFLMAIKESIQQLYCISVSL